MTKGNNVFALFTNPPRANTAFSPSKVKKSAIITKGRENSVGTTFFTSYNDITLLKADEG